MDTRTRIAVACRSLAERQTLLEWLKDAGFQAFPVTDLNTLRDRDALPFEVLIADADYGASDVVLQITRVRGTHRPVIVVGDTDARARADAERRGATFMPRPLDRGSLVVTVALVLAEGRPLRRSPRKLVPRLPGTIDGVTSRIIDVSYEGVRFELPEQHRSSLPPYFTMRVPMFNVALILQRVWVSSSVKGVLWCGATLSRNPARAADLWRSAVDTTPSASANTGPLLFL